MKIVGYLVIALIVVVGGWWLLSQSGSGNNLPATANNGLGGTATSTPKEVTITYSNQGFTPTEVTIAPGTKVTWKNESTIEMWVASAMHPTHSVYDNTTLTQHCDKGVAKSDDVFDACDGIAVGGTWSFTFDKAGTWKYHDHITSSKFGSIIVTAATSTATSTNAQ